MSRTASVQPASKSKTRSGLKARQTKREALRATKIKPPSRTMHKPSQRVATPSRKNEVVAKAAVQPERRLKMFRKAPPKTYLVKLNRAQTQRMIVIGRRRTGKGASLHEKIDIVGSTGNIYTITIGRLPSCTCPDYQKGNECKHKVYALHTVLKAPEHLQYQRAFLIPELEEIFCNAPLPSATPETDTENGKRKPIGGDCPICYMDLDEKNQSLVWCKAACGNNMHASCFEQWAASQKGNTVRCVYCRADWEVSVGDIKAIQKAGKTTQDGYINVANHFGMSEVRDTSSYHYPWSRHRYF